MKVYTKAFASVKFLVVYPWDWDFVSKTKVDIIFELEKVCLFSGCYWVCASWLLAPLVEHAILNDGSFHVSQFCRKYDLYDESNFQTSHFYMILTNTLCTCCRNLSYIYWSLSFFVIKLQSRALWVANARRLVETVNWKCGDHGFTAHVSN